MNGLIGSFLAFYSALGSWVKRRGGGGLGGLGGGGRPVPWLPWLGGFSGYFLVDCGGLSGNFLVEMANFFFGNFLGFLG